MLPARVRSLHNIGAGSLLSATMLVVGTVGPATSQSGVTTVIHGRFVEEHYIMEGDAPRVTWTWEFTLTLSGKGAIHEEWSGHNTRNLQKSNAQDYTLGSSAGSVTWHVLGSNKLQKTINFRQHTQTLTIATIGKECRLDVTFRLKPGFSDMLTPRADTGEWAHFSLPKTLEASCTIS
jgi:hypothetical protein